MTRIFSRSDIEGLVKMSDAVKVIEDCFQQHAQGLAINNTTNFLNGKSNVSMKAAYIKESWVGLKSLGLVILCRQQQLRIPIAILEQSPITFLRTGAAGAVAAKYLCAPGPVRVGILGSGRQARAQLLGLSHTVKIENVVVWSPSQENARKYALEMSDLLKISVTPVATAKESVVGRNLIVTATKATKPILESNWIEPGMHINAIGTDFPGNQELPSELFSRARVFADEIKQAIWMGAINVAISSGEYSEFQITGSLGEVIAQKKQARKSTSDLTIFDCSGLGMMDVALAKEIFERSGSNIHEFDLQK